MMRPNQPRQKCECGLTFRYENDFQEHKRVGCAVKNGKGDSLSVDPDKAATEELTEQAPDEVPAVTEEPKKRSRKK
jgi:hypothetical protein